MAPQPGIIPFAIAKELLSNAVAVRDLDLQRAVSYACQRLKLIVEPGGSAGLAALLAAKFDMKNKAIAIVLTGGNCDIAMVAQCCAAVADP
jgi:threonine dehydratase